MSDYVFFASLILIFLLPFLGLYGIIGGNGLKLFSCLSSSLLLGTLFKSSMVFCVCFLVLLGVFTISKDFFVQKNNFKQYIVLDNCEKDGFCVVTDYRNTVLMPTTDMIEKGSIIYVGNDKSDVK